MPGYSRIAELQLELNSLERQINFYDGLITHVDHLRDHCPRGSPRDELLWSTYNLIDDHLDNLNQQWQNIFEEIERLRNA